MGPRVTRRNVITFYMQEITESDIISLFISILLSPNSATRLVGDEKETWAKM